jgi:hypothetical protein
MGSKRADSLIDAPTIDSVWQHVVSGERPEVRETMVGDQGASVGPTRLSPEEWLKSFTDFGKLRFHPDPPYLRPRQPEAETLRLKKIASRQPTPTSD